MSITPWLPIVRKIKDGEAVDQATVNVPIDQLTQREQHLYEKFEELQGKSVLISFGQPIHPGETLVQNELNLVYFKSDNNGEGVARGLTGFSSDTSSNMFSPNNSNYTFGLTKVIYPKTRTADIYTEGLCELHVDLDDPVRGLIQKQSGGNRETFAVGPYYLSAKDNGKITRDPSGIPVYVGYAISKRKFLLHTNVDEFSQFFINYRYHVLDRVAGIPSKSDSNIWSITTTSFNSPPTYVADSGSVAGVTVSNTSTAYEGYILGVDANNATTLVKVDHDVYTIEVTTGGVPTAAKFKISSEKNNQDIEQTNVGLDADKVLFVDTNLNNNLKLNFTGSTNFTLGSKWTLSVYNYKNRLGWIPVGDTNTAKPVGAKFFYNIPPESQMLLDTGLDTQLISDGQSDSQVVNFERDEALELNKYLPPIPANFVQLYINGALIRYSDIYDVDGMYSINEYGLWWHSDKDGEQPWSSEYPTNSTTGSPHNWADDIKPDLEASRKNIFLSFSKFNPALRTQLVSSLTAFNLEGNTNASNFIKFYTKEGETYKGSHTGDLFVDIDAQIDVAGYTDNANFTYPLNTAETYTSNRAIAALKYSKPEGKFKAATTSVVARLLGTGGITVTEQTPGTGVWSINYAAQGSSGQVDSIEPINARLEFRELSSYIKLPPPSATPYGLIGKIVLPAGYTNNRPLRLVFHIFGDTLLQTSSLNRAVAFQFEYAVVTASNGATRSDYTIVNTTKYAPVVNPVEFNIMDAGMAYNPFTSRRISHTDLVVPAQYIKEESVVNFKILRTSPLANSYTGNIGLLATYWEIPAT